LRRSVLLGIVLAVACATGRAPALTLWDADFNEQPLGPLPTGDHPDGPPDLPTFLRAGSTYDVVPTSGDLLDQPLEISNTTGSSPRATFRLEQATDLDVLLEGLVHIELEMLGGACDTGRGSTCYKVAVLRDGGTEVSSIVWNTSDLSIAGSGGSPAIPYDIDVAKHIAIEVDLDAAQPWITYHVDDALLGTAPFPMDAAFDGLAVLGVNFAAGRYAFDNVLIEHVPEPPGDLLAALSVAVLLGAGSVRSKRAGARPPR
jgi:hypothetical protein